MSKVNQDVKGNPDLFKELLSDKKYVLTNTIQLHHKINNAVWLIGKSKVQHKNIGDEISLIIEQSKRESKYGIKLRCTSFTQEPFFRFDSDGPAHRNSFPDIPLEKQSVSTPHFNTFNDKGMPFAYKNETLKKEEEAKEIVEDINFGVSLFCMETNTSLSDGNFPNIVEKVPEIKFEDTKLINFDQINFE
ncbi:MULTISPECIES: hypothetical protein [Olivibacter]|uniref:Uncharacterized protein n=1 Tax=Olivibacter jilunii TaxID=985016 RepID=A0ABW6B423_9SPHI